MGPDQGAGREEWRDSFRKREGKANSSKAGKAKGGGEKGASALFSFLQFFPLHRIMEPMDEKQSQCSASQAIAVLPSRFQKLLRVGGGERGRHLALFVL